MSETGPGLAEIARSSSKPTVELKIPGKAEAKTPQIHIPPQEDHPDIKVQISPSAPDTQRKVVTKPATARPLERFFKREKSKTSEIEDEYNNKDRVTILEPIRKVEVKLQHGQIVSLDASVRGQLEYYSRTHDLEVDTDRVKLLQAVADEMLEGTGEKVRLVIANKGEEPNGCAFPDGTIIIYQSALNRLDTLDEAAGLIGHELGHVLKKTYEKKINANNELKKLGVGWVHEGFSDSMAPELMEKAGFNTLAFSTMIDKISEKNTRGVIHQSGHTRSSMSVGQHAARDYQTSSVEQTRLPDALKGTVSKTNMEIYTEAFAKGDVNIIGKLLSKMHPEDLGNAYKKLFKDSISRHSKLKTDTKILNEFSGLLKERLEKAGYSEDEILLFLATGSDSFSLNNLSLIQDQEVLSRVLDKLPDFHKNGQYAQMEMAVFNENSRVKPVDNLINLIGRHMRDPEVPDSYRKFPISEENVFKLLNAVDQSSQDHFDYELSRKSHQILFEYIEFAYVRRFGKEILSEETIRQFFQDATDLGVKIYGVNQYKASERAGEYRNIGVNPANLELVERVYKEMFGNKGSISIEVLQGLLEGQHRPFSFSTANAYKETIQGIRDMLDKNEEDDSKRLEFVKELFRQIDSLNPPEEFAQVQRLDQTKGSLTPSEMERQIKLTKTSLKFLTTNLLFSKDTDTYYSCLEEAMRTSGVNVEEISYQELFALSQSILRLDVTDYSKKQAIWSANGVDIIYCSNFVELENHDKLLKLPFLQALLKKEVKPGCATIGELNAYAQEFVDISGIKRDALGVNADIFNDDLTSIFLGKGIRENFQAVLDKGVTEEEFGDLYEFVVKFYPSSPLKTEITREFNRRYLRSSEPTIDDKTEFLSNNFNTLGPEGMVILAEQIEDIKTFEVFRQKMATRLEAYLEGSSLTGMVAGADYLTSFFSGRYDLLIKTAQEDEEAKREITTYLAEKWSDEHLHSRETNPLSLGSVYFDPKLEKFIVGGQNRSTFSTIGDTIRNLQGLNSYQRFAAAHKALTEEDGAFSSEANRIKLAETIKKSMNLKPGFVSTALESACRAGEARLLGFPAAQMLAPLIFRGFDLQKIDTAVLRGKKALGKGGGKWQSINVPVSDDQLKHIFSARTRDVVFFGAKYAKESSFEVGKMAAENNLLFESVTRKLKEHLATPTHGKNDKKDDVEPVDPTTEAVIKAVEGAGPLGPRSLQLSAQLVSFEPKVERRLSQSFDANSGLNKLLFWDNLYRMSQRDESVRTYVDGIRLKGYLGGGSLYTTYAAETTEGRKIVLKMLNPNAEALVKEGHGLATKVLERVRTKGSGKHKREAENALSLVDFAREWCLRDINDQTFEQDDDWFRIQTARYNRENDSDRVWVPERRLNLPKLKAEDQAEGMTLNETLKDPKVHRVDKAYAVMTIDKFYSYQLSTPAYQQDGKDVYIVHSDPHVGNFIVGKDGKIGVLDRNMYLRLSKEDVNVLGLLEKGDSLGFLNSLTGRVLDVNNVKSQVARGVYNGRVLAAVNMELAKQKLSGKQDNLALLRAATSVFQQAKLEVPFELRIMIRNIQAMKELKKRYGVS